MKTLTSEALKQSAISLLAQRDYSRQALAKKLQLLCKDQGRVQSVLNELEQKQLLKDDLSIAEYFVQQRINKGHGPLRIKHDLQQKGISASAVNDVLEAVEVDWQKVAELTRYKKFGETHPSDPKEKTKQIRFLQYRGFPAGIVMKLFTK